MSVEDLVRGALREQAAQQPPAPAGFADRVLGARRRRRTRRLASVAVATAAVLAVGIGVPLLDSGGKTDVRPSGVLDSRDVVAHPDQGPPRELIAAGRSAMAAYYTVQVVPRGSGHATGERTYWLLNPGTGRYEKDDRWSFVAVAPGLRTAAVLERTLPAPRIGLLDLATRKVERWIPVSHGIGGLAFSGDGRRLVATTYADNPDGFEEVLDSRTGRSEWGPVFDGLSRTGFAVVDVATGKGTWVAVAAGREFLGREDFAFSRAGDLLYSRIVGPRDGMQQFYDFRGRKVAAPANERHLRSDVSARLSPDGRLAAWGLVAEPHHTSYSSIRDPLTGKEIIRVRGAQLVAWADDKRLIAWERDPKVERYRPRLVLVTIGSGEVVPLSGFQEPNDWYGDRDWEPVFAER
ncbi:WD40 repeat domain-containing protein [Streptomyces sp. NPDC048304]|uniref:WD40 repeat domain-containing protein n=1 Tax=Streptomyces sp. NPDC048304 TaxID=3154820 RepID=UPI0033F1CF23